MIKLAGLASALVALAIGSGAAAQLAHAPDGGTIERINSIEIPPLKDAPFSATVRTEWTRYFEDGANRVIANHRSVARDREGRVFQERRRFVPPDTQGDSLLTEVDIADPTAHTVARCLPMQRMCELRFFAGRVPTALPPAGVSPNGTSALTRDALGTQTIGGVETIGTRELQTLSPAGVDRPMSIVKEFWYSPQLGINIVTTRTDPRSGREVFTVTDIQSSDPDPALFALPKDARVVDIRRPAPR